MSDSDASGVSSIPTHRIRGNSGEGERKVNHFGVACQILRATGAALTLPIEL